MSETARKLFEGLRSAMPGLNNVAGDIKAELSRLATQGTMELASGLFNGSAFVPYGPGQYTPSPEHQQDHQQEHESGRER